MKSINSLYPEITRLAEDYCKENTDLLIVNVCSEDGFVMGHTSNERTEIESDKMAAISSSISSISNSALMMISGKTSKLIIVESENYNFLLTQSTFRKKKCVVSFCASSLVSLAKMRFLVKRFGDSLSELS